MSTHLSPEQTSFSPPTNVRIMSVNEEQNIMNDGYHTNISQQFYHLDDVYPSQNPIGLHAQSYTLPSATGSSVPNMTAMNAMDYMNVTGDYVSYQETANHSHCPSNTHTMNISSHGQVESNTNSSYPVSFQTLLGFSGLGVGNNYLSNHAANQPSVSISYIFTQMPMQTSHLSNNSNEFANPRYAVTKVECTHLGMISAADVENILPTPQ